ncbi:hypothetical protein CABS01_04412 [Colletotrichum abscissum]|uniref:uncharacterized protein n=1 Tax=Colletotrichum abscissum TaxID=1671311 RepID=UPI0027D649B8|nr:uncharacterized protein CABS01_04412 [Colletotrichum abscissum]KAK1473750.1 hypothetical protein CABS01_04412 [Colletotrichum abscissum]
MGMLLASATQQPENASIIIVENANNVKTLSSSFRRSSHPLPNSLGFTGLLRRRSRRPASKARNPS